jgi:hypothetical protein
MTKSRVNEKELRQIVDQAEADRKEREEREKEAALESRRKTTRRANEVIAGIPDALKEAAKNAKKTDRGLVVTAEILITKETMGSVMATRGYLDEDDEKVLRAVRRRIKKFNDLNITLKEFKRTESFYFQSSGGDCSKAGPCVCYYIRAKTVIKD